MVQWHFCKFFQLLCLGSAYTWSRKQLSTSILRKSVPKGLICLGFEDPKPKNWLIFQKCHWGSDIWPRVELDRCQKLFSTSVQNWTEAIRFVRVQKSLITFLLLLPRKPILSLENSFGHPPTHLLCCCCCAPATRKYLTFDSFAF